MIQPHRKLTDLNPNWVDGGGPGISRADGTPAPLRRGVYLEFDCPCGCDERVCIPVNPPLDKGEPADKRAWQRIGDDFATMTLRPSIQRLGKCRWHGWITNGEAVPAI